MNTYRKLLIGMLAALATFSVQAEVVSSSADHYILNHTAVSPLSPDELWLRLVEPASWWHPDHTYSGDASNLSLQPSAGGHWREQWGNNSVLHGVVLNIDKGKLLRLDAPFGPLQELAVKVIWTITIEADGSGSKVMFDEVANGVSNSKLDELARAVDFVKQEAITRLTTK